MLIKLDLRTDSEDSNAMSELELWPSYGLGEIFLQITDSGRVISLDADELFAAVELLRDASKKS